MFNKIGMFEVCIDESMSDESVIAFWEKESPPRSVSFFAEPTIMGAVITVTIHWLKARIDDYFRRKNEQDPDYIYRRLFDYSKYDPEREQEPSSLGVGYTLEEESETKETIENESISSWRVGRNTCYGTKFDRVTYIRKRAVKALWVKALKINRGSDIGQEVWLKSSIFGEDTWRDWSEIRRRSDRDADYCEEDAGGPGGRN